jgi:hypothetical protein
MYRVDAIGQHEQSGAIGSHFSRKRSFAMRHYEQA